MSTLPSLRAILTKIIAENGGMARVGAGAKSFALLVAMGFAGVMPLAAGYELYRVHDVSQWPIVPGGIPGTVYLFNALSLSLQGSCIMGNKYTVPGMPAVLSPECLLSKSPPCDTRH